MNAEPVRDIRDDVNVPDGPAQQDEGDKAVSETPKLVKPSMKAEALEELVDLYQSEVAKW